MSESIVASLLTLLLTAGLTGIAWVLVKRPDDLIRRMLEVLLAAG